MKSMMNMSRLIMIFAFLAVLVPARSSAQGAKGTATKAPMAYEAFFKKDMRKFDGTFPVYRGGEKYYVEIPASALGRELLVTGRVVRGGSYGTVSSVTNVLVFELGVKNTLEVRQRICSDRAEGDLAKAIEASGMQPVENSFPIVAYGPNKEGYILDITKDVNASGNLFSFPNVKTVNSPVADRSGLDSIYVIRDGVKFISQHAQTDVIPGFMHIPPRDMHTTALIEWSLQLLPEHNVTAREADARVGYSVISYNDYDRNPTGVKRVREIQRWNLEVKPEDAARYRQGELVEPANPIRVYMDRTLSSGSGRRAVMRAVEEWNRCFEAAGFANVLQVQEGEPEVSVAYHQIVYSYGLGASQFTQISDSRTGEILSGTIVLSDKELTEQLLTIQFRLGGYEPAVLTDSMPVVREEFLRWQASNLTGKMMGLLPNLAGSAAFTTEQLRNAAWVRENGISASVTDGFVVNFAAQPGDGMALRDLFPKASVYDRWAIEWGYRQYPGADVAAEKKALGALAAQAKDNASLYFATKGSADYRAVETDLGQNTLETAALGLKNLERLAPRVSDIYLEEIAAVDAPWTEYIKYISDFNILFQSYLLSPLNCVGGISVEPVIAGYNERPMTYLSKRKGEMVMEFLNRNLFQAQPEWRTDPLEMDVIGNKGETKSTGIIMSVCRGLMSQPLLERLMMAEVRGANDVYTLNDLFKTLERDVFLDYSAAKPVDRYRVLVQYNLVREFVSTFARMKAKEGSNDLAYFLVNQGERMRDKIEYLGKNHRDAYSRRFYRGLGIYLNRAMESGKLSGLVESK